MNIQRKLHLIASGGSIKAERFPCFFLLLIGDFCLFFLVHPVTKVIALCKGLRFQLCLERAKCHVSPDQALSFWLFGSAIAHNVSLSLWFLVSSFFMIAGNYP